MTCDVSAEPQI